MCPPLNKISLKLTAAQRCNLHIEHNLASEVITGEDMADVFRRVKEFQQKHRMAHIGIEGRILADPEQAVTPSGQEAPRCDCAPGWPCAHHRS